MPRGSGRNRIRRPAGTRVELDRGGASLSLRVPKGGLKAAAGTAGFAVAWNSFIAFWTASAITGGAPLLFTAFSIPFWAAGASMSKQAFAEAAEEVSLELTPSRWRCTVSAMGKTLSERSGDCADIDGARADVEGYVNDTPITSLVVDVGVDKLKIAGLKSNEIEWIAAEINGFLADIDADN